MEVAETNNKAPSEGVHERSVEEDDALQRSNKRVRSGREEEIAAFSEVGNGDGRSPITTTPPSRRS